MIVEGLCTTIDERGQVNLAPMGPIVVGDFDELILRPFPGSTTYDNLRRSGHAVFHVTDNAVTIALSAINQLGALPELAAVPDWDVPRLTDCVRWYALSVASWDDAGDRPRAECQIVASGTVREFWGFNRARHALVEAAIVATRLAWIPPDEVAARLAELSTIVEKTGGSVERQALDVVRRWIQTQQSGGGA